MRKVNVFVDGVKAGELHELERGSKYLFLYDENYQGTSVSLEMPLVKKSYEFDRFPPFFEGLLPEGMMLEGLLRKTKIDRDDLLGQLVVVGKDLVGNVTIGVDE